MQHIEMELRNLPRHRIIEYLQEAGGTRTAPTALRVKGNNWEAWLEEMPPAKITVMSIRRDLLIIEGSDSAVPTIYDHMRFRTMRGGG